MTNYSLVTVLSGMAVVAHGPAKPSCEQVIASLESCMTGQGFSPYTRWLGGACASPDGKGEILHFVDLPTFYPEMLRNLVGNAHPRLCSACPRIPLSFISHLFLQQCCATLALAHADLSLEGGLSLNLQLQ